MKSSNDWMDARPWLRAWFPGFATNDEYSWRLTNGSTWRGCTSSVQLPHILKAPGCPEVSTIAPGM
jgi:hypothetical protein